MFANKNTCSVVDVNGKITTLPEYCYFIQLHYWLTLAEGSGYYFYLMAFIYILIFIQLQIYIFIFIQLKIYIFIFKYRLFAVTPFEKIIFK